MEIIKSYNEENFFKTRFTDSGMFILALLVLTLIALGERVLYDLARNFVFSMGPFSYFDDPRVIVIHAVFIIGLLIISILLNYVFGRRREKYALALIPYFLVSIILAVQLSIQLAVYFTNHHNNLQFYLVMTLLVMVSSYAIFHIQNNYLTTKDTSRSNTNGLLIIFLVIFTLFTILILSFGPQKAQNYLPPQVNDYNSLNNNSYNETPVTLSQPQSQPSPQNSSTAQTPTITTNQNTKLNITGNYFMYMNYLGVNYQHDMYLYENDSGSLSGSGGAVSNGSRTNNWVITSGNIVGQSFSFIAEYTSPQDVVVPQDTLRLKGTISSNRAMSGTWSDNYHNGSRTGSFTILPKN